MTLRKKAVVFILVIAVLFLGGFSAVSQIVLLGGFEHLEADEVTKDAERALKVLGNDLSQLDEVVTDWAWWDDAYVFAQDGNQTFIETNLVDQTFNNLRINLLLVFNSSGGLVQGKAYDLQDRREMPLPAGLAAHLAPTSPLVRHTSMEGAVAGVLTVPGHVVLVSSRPILTSLREGPIGGALIMGRYVDEPLVESLGEVAQLSMTAQRLDEPDMDEEHKLAKSQLSAASPVWVRVLDGGTVAGYGLVEDIYGKPALMLRVGESRDIYNQGLQTLNIMLVARILTLGILIVIIYFFLERLVLSRLFRLSASVSRIGSTASFAGRVPIDGSDEIAKVGKSINVMLEALEWAQRSAQDSELKLQKLYEEEHDLRRELEAEIRKRSEYTRALVHELKTPITAMMASSELLATEAKDEPVVSLARNIHQGTASLDARIDELYDLARGEVGMLTLKPKETSGAALLRSIVADMTLMAANLGLALSLDLPEAPLRVIADEVRLRQVVYNLLSNAFKFTPEGGGVTVRAQTDGVNLVIEVTDTGRGITDDELPRVFEPYHRLGDKVQHGAGMGVGLSLSRMLVELHGGRIWARSELGKGSTFSFSMPLSGPPGSVKVTEEDS